MRDFIATEGILLSQSRAQMEQVGYTGLQGDQAKIRVRGFSSSFFFFLIIMWLFIQNC